MFSSAARIALCAGDSAGTWATAAIANRVAASKRPRPPWTTNLLLRWTTAALCTGLVAHIAMNTRVAALCESHVGERLLSGYVVGVDTIAQKRSLSPNECIAAERCTSAVGGAAAQWRSVDSRAAERTGHRSQSDVGHVIGNTPPIGETGQIASEHS